jgi:hypothetical protein
MYALRTAAVLVAAGLSVARLSLANDSPFFHLKQTTKRGTIQVTGTNTSHTPIVAYVVIFERAHQRTVWHGVYTRGDVLRTGKSVRVGVVPQGTLMGRPSLILDYVRLSDGTSWGNAQTDEAKEIEASFRK